MGVLSFRGDQAESGRRGAEGDLMACLDLWAVERRSFAVLPVPTDVS